MLKYKHMRTKKKSYNEQKKYVGFTIVEVIIVLAIAGLIFLMVFIGLPALQRQQRNSQRKNDLALIQAAILEWQKNNPDTTLQDHIDKRYDANGFCTFYNKYLPDLKDPSTGHAYRVSLNQTKEIVDCTNESFRVQHSDKYDKEGADANHAVMGEPGEIQYNNSGICDGENTQDVKIATNSFVLRMYLEGGGITCIDAGVKMDKSVINNDGYSH